VNEVPVQDTKCSIYSTPLRIGDDFLLTESDEFFAKVSYILVVRRTMDQYVIDMCLAYACDIADEYFIDHTALEENNRAFKTHNYSE